MVKKFDQTTTNHERLYGSFEKDSNDLGINQRTIIKNDTSNPVPVQLVSGGAGLNKSVQFLDGNDYINIGDVPELKFTNTSAFTIGAYTKHDTTATGERIIASKQGASNNAGYRTTLQAGGWRFHLAGTSSSNRIEARSSLSGSNTFDWFLPIWSYAGDNSTVTFNLGNFETGLFIKDTGLTKPTDALTTSIDTSVGFQVSGRNGTSSTFMGFISYVFVFNKVLDQAGLDYLWNGGSGIPDLTGHPDVANLVYWGNPDSAIYPSLPDTSGNGNNGIMTNFSGGQGQIVKEVP